MYRVILEVKEVRGFCSAGYKPGDRLVIQEPSVLSKESADVCLYAIGALLPYLTALYRDTPREDWINQVQELQCPDVHNTVVFKVIREKL
ncbi:MAG: TIGR04076 family protein [Hadesarchaea archaeon]|jgi:uncharacterized repeat protein (TIGR04076 family)|nr:MAG: TIGR04076 family protein [Hadesarchaea archaeon]